MYKIDNVSKNIVTLMTRDKKLETLEGQGEDEKGNKYKIIATRTETEIFIKILQIL
jgi:hypothetical protein